MINNHVEENLNNYITIPKPEYALLLSGNWGSGKTHFINDFVKNFKNDEVKFIKISLFGLKDTGSIDEKIFQELHPILGSKYAKLAGNMFKGALKLGINIDIDDDDKSDGKAIVNLSSLNIFSEEDEKKSKKELIFIFDDLERTDIPLSEVLGYINYFVEELNFKVIILANVDEIKEDKKFLEFKEKVIGKTFEIQQDFNEILNSLLDSADVSKNALQDNKNVIIDVYNKASYENLRHVRQTILDFDYFYKAIDQDLTINHDFMKQLIYEFFALSIEIKKGDFCIEEFKGHDFSPWDGFSFNHSGENKKKEKTQTEKIMYKYNLLPYGLLFTKDTWIDILYGSKIIKEEITKAILSTSYFNTQERETWINIWYFRDLEDNDFKINFEDVENKFYNNKYIEHEKLLHVIALLLYFSKSGIYNKTIKDILEQARKNIEDNKKTALWQKENFSHDGYFNSYSLGYYERESKEFLKIYDYLQNASEEAFNYGLEDKANLLLEDFKNNDIESVVDKLSNKFHDIAIFSQVNKGDFINSLAELKHTNISTIVNAMKSRYEAYKLANKNLLPELAFWLHVDDSLLNDICKETNPVKYLLLKGFKEYTLKEIIDNLEKLEDSE